MTKLGALIVSAAIMTPLPAIAYTQEDANACTPDVFRLCQQAIPDAGRVAHCLAAKKSQLSAACATVFNRHEQKTIAERERPDNLRQTKY
ncbi:MAG TPA: hypothetical protein VIE87_11965 [Pseudolabrys sp.]|jgi:hypothetical protein